MKTKNILSTLFVAIFGGLLAVFVYSKIAPQKQTIITERVEKPVNFAQLPSGNPEEFNFIYAAQKTVEAVVHVTTKSVRESYNPLRDWLYDDGVQRQEVVGYGSGVIISADGYVVTNNHVVENSTEINVTLNDKRDFSAKVIGREQNTDLALLKIDGEELQYVEWGNSDDLQVGEWVLAVGNPFNLNSTVTAGIVSAKAKNIGIIGGEYSMESFIQTDAAVNRGNSGGALVNTRGELVGINTAIVSPSGGYAGISFAVPVSIVQKIVKDLIEFGSVQRAILGVNIADINAKIAEEKDLDNLEGVLVVGVTDNGAAKKAGIKENDVIVSVNKVKVNSVGELQEQVSRYRPNDKVTVVVKRSGKLKQFDVVLRNLHGSTEIVKDGFDSVLGATFAKLSSEEKKKLGIQNGIKIVSLNEGKLRSDGVKEGFIIQKVNQKPVNEVSDIKTVLNNTTGGGILIEGLYPNGDQAVYAFRMD